MFIKTTFNSDLNHILNCVNKCDFGTKCFAKVEHFVLRLINAPEHFLTKEDIKNVFWPQEDKPDNKIHNHISTLKSSIKNFPEYQIITEPKKGYRLVISSNG